VIKHRLAFLMSLEFLSDKSRGKLSIPEKLKGSLRAKNTMNGSLSSSAKRLSSSELLQGSKKLFLLIL